MKFFGRVSALTISRKISFDEFRRDNMYTLTEKSDNTGYVNQRMFKIT